MGALLDQAALQMSREREASQPRTPLLLLPDLLRNALSGSVLIKAASAVHLAPVAHTDHLHHLHHQHLIEHLVNDAVIPYTHPVNPDFALKPTQLGGRGFSANRSMAARMRC